MSEGQSDPPVLLRGGRADHTPTHRVGDASTPQHCYGGASMGKERAERLHEQSAHAAGRTVPRKSVSSTLLGLREKAKREPFNRCDVKGSNCFTFLGFEFYSARTRKGKVTVKRRTSKKKFKASLASLKEWVRNNRSRPLRELAVTLRRKFTGYFNYYGVIGNSERLWCYWSEARKIIFRALNRRSQRLSFNWAGFSEMWKTLAIPNPHIVEKPYQRNYTWKLSYR